VNENGKGETENADLIAIATQAREHAFAPYSLFRVGAALEAADGRIFTGCNVESASYGMTVCAERVAIWKAISVGARDFGARLAIVVDTEHLTPPCGTCRQIIWEFCPDVTVILANLRGESQTYHIRDLIPYAFDSKFLAESEAARHFEIE
jgi:cytidine deaminase